MKCCTQTLREFECAVYFLEITKLQKDAKNQGIRNPQKNVKAAFWSGCVQTAKDPWPEVFRRVPTAREEGPAARLPVGLVGTATGVVMAGVVGWMEQRRNGGGTRRWDG